MFGKAYRLPFRLAGIPVYLDWSFLIILPLLAWIIGAQVEMIARQFHLPVTAALTAPATRYALGLIAAVGLFIAVILHELGHALVARRFGVRVQNITLWFLGGVAQMEEIPTRPGEEALIGIAGPLVSFALAAVCWGLSPVVPAHALRTQFVLKYLGYMNLVLGAFNLIPALPLDGGRVLRSLLALAMPHAQATRITGAISKVLAVLLGIVGFFYNIFLLFIAFFIYAAVSAETRRSEAKDLLEGASVGDLMNRDVRTVPSSIPVSELMQRMLHEHHLGFPVVDDVGRLRGIVSVRELQGRGPDEAVGQVMSPQVPTVDERAKAADAFDLMAPGDVKRLVVVDKNGRIVGIVTKADLLRWMKLRSVNSTMPPNGSHAAQPTLWAEPSEPHPRTRI